MDHSLLCIQAVIFSRLRHRATLALAALATVACLQEHVGQLCMSQERMLESVVLHLGRGCFRRGRDVQREAVSSALDSTRAGTRKHGKVIGN